MLDKLYIKNFKCFDEIDINFNNITLLCGTNSSGKSSAIQALLLAANNAGQKTGSPLNGQWLNLGSFNESRNFLKNANSFEIIVTAKQEKLSFKFKRSDNNTTDVKVEKINKSSDIEKLLNYHNKHIFYLPAARKGPEDFYPKSFDEFNFLGSNGEFIIDYFFKNRTKTLKKNKIKDKSGNTLETQVNYWLNKILKVRLKVEDWGITNILSAKFSYGGNNDVRPYHIGAGVSYITGIIISSLSAEPDNILIIENPEIHLHPKAQADLTEFLCFIANAGTQIIIESHSDHIFNGIRKAVAKKYINKNKTAIHFFELDNEFLSKNTEIELADTGGIITYKKGLFDQFDDDLDQLLGLE